jgi:hypothetical protein
LRDKGLHHLPEGKALIKYLSKQMKNYHLSTSNIPIVKQTQLQSRLFKLLNGPSNYIVKGGKS